MSTWTSDADYFYAVWIQMLANEFWKYVERIEKEEEAKERQTNLDRTH